MRLIKFEESVDKGKEQSHVTFAAMKEAEASALRDHKDGIKIVQEEEIGQSQFMNLQRVPDVVNKNFLTNSTLLSNGELLVDMNSDLISGATIPLERFMPQQYEELLHDELTEDDKRLAAALVAVQLVNQQKQQSGNQMQPMLGQVGHKLVPGNELNVLPTMTVPSQKTVPVGNYMQSVGSGLMVQQPLPPLKKALSRNRYMRPHLAQVSTDTDHQAHLESLGIHTETEPIEISTEPIEISTEEIEISNSEVIKSELGDYIIHEEGNNIKTEVTEVCDILSEEEHDHDGELLADSDEDNRRNSLPHKKRIPRKLKNPKKTSQPRTVLVQSLKFNKCPEYYTNAVPNAAHKAVKRSSQANVVASSASAFACELCFKSFTNQWKFFEHLKSHYEPLELDVSLKKLSKVSSVIQNDAGGGASRRDVKMVAVKPKVATNHIVATQSSKPAPSKIRSSPSSTVHSKWLSSQLPDVTITPASILQQTLTNGRSETQASGGTAPLWECQPCKRVFRRQKTLETHMNVAHPKEEDIEEFSDPEDMMEGIKVQVHSDDDKDGTDRGDCRVQKEWYREDELHATEADIREIEANNKTDFSTPTACELCNESFESKAHLNQHIQEHHAELMSALTKTFRRAGSEGTAKKGHLSCKQCGRLFHHRNSLVYHLKSHLGQRPHQCEVCGKGFFANSALKVHMRQHSGVKPFKCEFCGRNFRQWGDLKYHCISIHSDQKNYQCEYCGKDFARKYSLTVHSRIHTGERNYQCEFCEKSFRASTYLQNHRRIHTGEKPHPCTVCGKPFRVRSDMKRHMITHTKEPYPAFLVKAKSEPDGPCSPDSKMLVQVESQMSEVEVPKVEELEVSTVESILPDGGEPHQDRLEEGELGVAYTSRDPLEHKPEQTLYVWGPVYMA